MPWKSLWLVPVTSKAAKRQWFLKKLKRTGVSQEDLVYYYQAVIRHVLEYACPVWHSSITSQQSKSMDSIQRRACQIILSDRTYSDACSVLGLPRLHIRHQELSQKLFHQLNRNNNCLHYLIPDMRDPSITDRLRRREEEEEKFINQICKQISSYFCKD